MLYEGITYKLWTTKSGFAQLIIHDEKTYLALVEVFKRALNTWDAPPEVREMHDLLVHGELLQDYRVHDV